MKLSIDGKIETVDYHKCGDPRKDYCVAVIKDGSPVSAHTLPKSWPYGATGTIKTSGHTYKWVN